MNDKLQQAINAIKADNKTVGQRLLAQVIKADPGNEVAWLWMSVAVDDLPRKKQCLQKVLKINPGNEAAKRKLAALQPRADQPKQVTASRVATESPLVESPSKYNPIPPTESTRTEKSSRSHEACKLHIITEQVNKGGVGNDIKDVGKTTAGVAFGILSAPVILAILSCILLMVCCGIFLSLSGLSSSYSQSTSPSSTRFIPPTYTPIASNRTQNPVVPTLIPTAAIPADIPTAGTNSGLDELVRRVVGTRLESLSVETFTEYDGQPYPEGRKGYHIELEISSPRTRSRAEMLEMAYGLTHDFYFNFDDTKPMYLTLHLRADPESTEIVDCVFGLGIGHLAVPNYLPVERPDDLESWYDRLVESGYYGDLPGETEALLAYGNDPSSRPFCKLDEWKK